MQVPKRRGELNIKRTIDYVVTAAKLAKMQAELEHLTNTVQPKLAQEVHRTGLFGDFSENAEYKEAKAELRRVLGRIASLQKRIAHAVVIEVSANPTVVSVGVTVTLEINNDLKKYTLVGASESRPAQGLISHLSPLGQALLGAGVGDNVAVSTPQGERIYVIKSITQAQS